MLHVRVLFIYSFISQSNNTNRTKLKLSNKYQVQTSHIACGKMTESKDNKFKVSNNCFLSSIKKIYKSDHDYL